MDRSAHLYASTEDRSTEDGRGTNGMVRRRQRRHLVSIPGMFEKEQLDLFGDLNRSKPPQDPCHQRGHVVRIG
jgi:hypothetical protein